MWSAGCVIFNAETRQYNKVVSLHSQVLVMLVDTYHLPLVVHSLHYVCTLNIWHNECRRGAIAQTGPQAILQLCPAPYPLHSAATVLIWANINYLQSPPLVDCRVIPLLSALISMCPIIVTFTVRRTGWPRVDKIHCVIVMAILFFCLIPVLIAGLSPWSPPAQYHQCAVPSCVCRKDSFNWHNHSARWGEFAWGMPLICVYICVCMHACICLQPEVEKLSTQ